uniref:Suppressor of cytokine signaling 7 n=1 Tax=Oreochromis niloticus TaxID=8128 RepID=A0A669DGD4_ORENI
MNDAQQEMSPDFVLMRLVSAAEYDRLDEPDELMSGGGGFGPVKAALGRHGGGFDVDSGGPSAGLGSASPHYSSPLPGKGELSGGLGLTQAPSGSETPLSPPPSEDFVDFPVPRGHGSAGHGAQLMVLQNLLRSGDRILECGLDATAGPGGGKDQSPPSQVNLQPQQLLQWHPVLRLGSQAPQRGVPALDSESGSVLCHTHHLLTDRLAKWPPGLLDQALRAGLLEPRKTCPPRCQDPVLAPAQRPVHPGEGREGGGGQDLVLSLPRCSCHGVLASGSGGIGPGEDPSETSDALLVLEGLGSEEVGGLGAESGDAEGEDTEKTEWVVGAGTCRSSLAVLGATVSLPSCADPQPLVGSTANPCPYPPVRSPLSQAAAVLPDPLPSSDPSRRPQHQHQSRSQPQSRAATPKLGVASGGGEKMPRGKSRKGGSLKVRLSKLFRTKSSSGGSGDWGELSPPPTPPPPPRRSLSLLDDFGGPPQQHGPFMERSAGASMQSLPPRPMALPPSLNTIQHSLSLNGSVYLDPSPAARRPPPAPRLAPRCPLSRPDAGSFATSLRELEKCGWYWGPMNWEDAEMKLKGKPDGSFLVRDSSDPRYILSLSFRSQGVTHHTRMEHYRGTFSLWCHPKFEDRCHSVVEFIERAIMHSKNGKFLYFLRSRVPGLPPTPVQLLYPVSRFSSVKSLQHLCRFCIRQLVRIDHIQELPLPTPLIAYLRKFYYYDPEEEISPTLKEDKEQKEEKERVTEGGGQLGVESQT